MTSIHPKIHRARAACTAVVPALLALAGCGGGGGEGRAELQLLSSCHLPPMEGVSIPLANQPQIAGEERQCDLIVRNLGPAASRATRFRFVDGDGMRLSRLAACNAADLVACPATVDGAGTLPDLPPGGQYVLTAMIATPAGRNGVASARFEVSAGNDVPAATRSVTIDADLRSADLRWGALVAPAQAAPGATVRIEALLQNIGPGDLYPMLPRLLEPAGASLQAVSFRGADGSTFVPAYLGRYANWGGLAAGSTLRLLIDVALPAGATGTQRVRLQTPDSSDPVPGNDLLEFTIDVR